MDMPMQIVKAFPINLVYDSAKDKWNKRPAIPRGQDWHTYESTKKEMAHAKNIGVIIPEGIVLIDVDTHKGVNISDIDAALGCKLDWANAHVQNTPSGGAHYAFTIPTCVTIRQGSDLLGVKGFDTRTSGNGWIATGDNYEDLTFEGLPSALCDDVWPELPSEAITTLLGKDQTVDNNDSDDFFAIVQAQPLDNLTVDEVKVYLKTIQDDVNGYDTWLKVGLALYRQFEGQKLGLQLWAKWSQASDDYNEDELKAKWVNFATGNRSNPITFAYVIHRAGGRKVLQTEAVTTLEEQAELVCDKESYLEFKDQVRAVTRTTLPDDLRAMLAATIVNRVGRDLGLSKTEVKKAFTPRKNEQLVNADDEIDKPDWVDHWVYVETICQFANTKLNYTIKREAFNAKYDRQADCLLAEKSAATMALVDYHIDTVVDTMYWPSADRIFTYEDKEMLNTYKSHNVEPCDHMDDDGQQVVDRLINHIKFTLEDEREQQILLDWMAYVVQNAGKRVNWALLLQGSQGNGKSYFVNLLQAILGRNVTNLDGSAIAGRFTGWAHGSLVVAVEEIRVTGANKYETLDRMKPFISNKTVQIEEKGRDHRTVPNFTSYLLLSNYKDALPIVRGDRRYCVLYSRIQSEEALFDELGGEEQAAAYFSELFDETERRADALAKFLLDYKISENFNPVGRAPATHAREKMMGIAVSNERLSLEDAINKHECDVINNNILDVTRLNELCSMGDQELPQKRAMSAILLEMGYEQIEKRRMKVQQTGNIHYVWFAHPMNNESAIKTVRDYYNDDF